MDQEQKVISAYRPKIPRCFKYFSIMSCKFSFYSKKPWNTIAKNFFMSSNSSAMWKYFANHRLNNNAAGSSLLCKNLRFTFFPPNYLFVHYQFTFMAVSILSERKIEEISTIPFSGQVVLSLHLHEVLFFCKFTFFNSKLWILRISLWGSQIIKFH